MAVRVYCSVLAPEDVKLTNNEVEFIVGDEKHSFYLSRRAMCKLIEQMSHAIGETLEEMMGVSD